MKNKKFSFRAYLCFCLFYSVSLCTYATEYANITHEETGGSQVWMLENDILKLEVGYASQGSIALNSFYNKEAGVDYLADNKGCLFELTGQFLPQEKHGGWKNTEGFVLCSDELYYTRKPAACQSIYFSTLFNHVCSAQTNPRPRFP